MLDHVLDPKRTVHIAIRDPAGEFEHFAHETGQTVIDIDQFYDLGVEGVIAETRRIVGNGPTYISFDVDGLDPAYTPGTGTPAVGGITSYEAKRLLQGLRRRHCRRGCRRGLAALRYRRHYRACRRATYVRNALPCSGSFRAASQAVILVLS